VVLLKSRAQAVADGDHIYGIIRGTAINHGGKTNGYSVPNPTAQAAAIRQALRQAGVSPRGISYLEAHGTGTSLGDPIEIAALCRAFQEVTDDCQYCAIGSVKSNIGHCESAAGISGLTKVLLQLKYRQLVPSLHSQTLNPDIDFRNSPFVVQQTLSDWKPMRVIRDGQEIELPRVAGISSFGAGGSNAHLLVEEYVEAPLSRLTAEPCAIVLSARNEASLRELAGRLAQAVRNGRITDANLEAAAFSLQVGREAFDERLATSVWTATELEGRLAAFARGTEVADDMYRGNARSGHETLGALTRDTEFRGVMASWIAKGEYGRLLELWVKGLEVPWRQVLRHPTARRIGLPTYPFKRERHWAPKRAEAPGAPMPAPRKPGAPVFLTKAWKPEGASWTRRVQGVTAILSTHQTAELAARLAQRFAGARVVAFEDIDSDLKAGQASWLDYDGVIDLCGCDSAVSDSLAWVTWLQTLLREGKRDGLLLLGVTRALESFDHQPLDTAGATRAALYRMLQSEYRQLQSRHLDVEGATSDEDVVQQIVSEYCSHSEWPEFCFRSGLRYRAYLESATLGGNGSDAIAWGREDVVLITGGTRGLGYLCAQHLVQRHGVRRLILLGREPIPDRRDWSAIVASDSPMARKVSGLRTLEKLGAEIMVWSFSLSDESTLAASIAEVARTWGPITGLVHAAGVTDLDNPAFVRKPLDRIEHVLEPKVLGLRCLLNALESQPLLLGVLFSSVSSAVPRLAAGQADYAMANAHMDYLAQAVAAGRSFPLVSVQWPSWKESGMGEATSQVYRDTGLGTLSNAEGLLLLDRILAFTESVVVVPAVVDPASFQPEELMRHAAAKKPASIEKPAALPDHVQDDSAAKRAQARVVEIVAKELGLSPERLDLSASFHEYGVDSVLLGQLLKPLGQLIGQDVEPSLLYEHSSIAALADWIVRTHPHIVPVTDAPALPLSPGVEIRPTAPSRPLASARSPGGSRPADTRKIAVIGLSCRFPGASDLDAYWQLLAEGRSSLAPVPVERWGHRTEFRAGLVERWGHFDPDYFHLPEADACAMDPQALALLEETLNLWCHAGYAVSEVRGQSVGVYMGGRSRHQPDEVVLRRARNPIVAVGQNYLASNLSQFFDLRGPSLIIDTACSSGLVAMDMAIQALLGGDIQAAVVGAVSMLDSAGGHALFSHRGILAQGDDFHLFDGRANGIVLGEGVGLVLLKTVEQALADGDTIYAVIDGLAINNDGKTVGPAAPNFDRQKAVIERALAKAGRLPEEIRYLEANGSGSELTDLLELKLIETVYRSGIRTPCALGSVKPNIGHPLAAAGIASFIKVVAMLHHGQRVPFLSGQQPMKHYALDASPFYFCRRLEPWEPGTRLAAINCFADGGTNAHVILQGWPDATDGFLRKPLARPVLNRRALLPLKAVAGSPPATLLDGAQQQADAHRLKALGAERNGRHGLTVGPISSWKRKRGL